MNIRIGIDVGSTTAKMVALDGEGKILHTDYRRHNARAREAVAEMLRDIPVGVVGQDEVDLRITGSVGMGLAERYGFPFVQEVVAAARAIRHDYPGVSSMIDIGGEDAKVVFFKDGDPVDLRMNGNCAGGTGAFIDQMAIILGIGVDELGELAQHSSRVYPMASRCGVFSKTDIQNLIAKNVCREDIAASIFHAVAVQTVVTLAHGCDIQPPVLFCGGPLTFIPALRQAFIDYLSLGDDEVILPQRGTLLPALGTALSQIGEVKPRHIDQLIETFEQEPVRAQYAPLKAAACDCDAANSGSQGGTPTTGWRTASLGLLPIFANEAEHQAWTRRISAHPVEQAEWKPGKQEVFIGIDSGSTTTKIVVTDSNQHLLYTYYQPNQGNPIGTVERGLQDLRAQCQDHGVDLHVRGCCSTGYGEDLIKAAFQLDGGIVETIAHYMAARHWDPQVSFILDIGGQDMKAIFVNRGVIDRIEINEACSSGCGSFVETFAKTLGYTAPTFAQEACRSQAPCDLGTRCTVFMNSKVKQVLREGATVSDIAAGLAYSVVKNCLYKVLKLSDLSVLGRHVVVQGGTMRSDAVVRALERLTGLEVTRSNVPELMGALGCALYAAQRPAREARPLEEIIDKAQYTQRTLHCNGCDNQCLIVKYSFGSGRTYYSGNRCEKIFSNGGGTGRDRKVKGDNVYLRKLDLLFGGERKNGMHAGPHRLRIGIPRVLNMFEDFPFWHKLFTACGFDVLLSRPSSFAAYEREARRVMSDNICFPAKLVHSHIQDLIDHRVDRIFMPFVVFERQSGGQNSFNCPIVSGYAEVVKGVQAGDIPIDAPAITFKDNRLLLKQCEEYLAGLGVEAATVRRAFRQALEAQDAYGKAVAEANDETLCKARARGELAVLLAGRPYHADPLIQHKVSELLADMGIHVLTDDIVRTAHVEVNEAHFLPQWAYPNRILQAAQWCATQAQDVQLVEMTSFGCGPDAFLVDEVRDLLSRHHKVLTLLKLDDINNVGSMKLRVRSLVESLKLARGTQDQEPKAQPFDTVPIFDERCHDYKIIVPYFTPFLSPLIPPLMRTAGYDVECLPMSDAESGDWGLKYANNEVCYPATLIVGDIIKALKSGRYDLHHTAVAMTQTGGQCRASNYIALIKKALVNAGFGQVPVVSLTLGSSIENNQPGFHVPWLRLLPAAFAGIIYSDCIAKFYYASVVREREPGQALRLKDRYLDLASQFILSHHSSELYKLIAKAAEDFNQICRIEDRPRVGIVGEIFLKFNPFAQHRVTDWLIEQGIEAVPPVMADFFLQSFVNSKAWQDAHVEPRSWLSPLGTWLYRIVRRQIQKVNRTASAFRYFTPFSDVFEEAAHASKVITLNAQFGEGWLLPAEILGYAREGVRDVVSLQPFGCIANHIVSKGIERRIKQICPDMNILSLDFDSGVSAVNVTNRMLLFVSKLKELTSC